MIPNTFILLKPNRLWLAFLVGLLVVPLLTTATPNDLIAESRAERVDISERLEDRQPDREPDPVDPPETEDTADPVCSDCEDEADTEEEDSNFDESQENDNTSKPKSDTRLSLYELGLLQLAAHDLFNVDREAETDSENGKLDLSTLLDYGEENIAIGGEPRNRENVILFSVAKIYGEQYEKYREQGRSDYSAKRKMIKKYHRELDLVYRKLFSENLPRPEDGEVTATENLALRTIHDFLPGVIIMNGEETSPIDHSLVGKNLSFQELKQSTEALDGFFDEAFLDVVVLIPPDTIMHIDLLERDSSFGEQFGADYPFAYFMHELEDGRYDKDDHVTLYIKSLFAKGLNF